MQRLDCTSSNHALFLTVYSSRIVISRLDVRHDATTGTDWVIPLPTPDGSCSAQTRKSHSLTPAFPSGAAAKVTVGRGKDRAQKVRDEVVISFPPAHTNEGHPRAFDYEVVAQAKNFRLVRRVFSTHAYWTESKDVEDVRCVFGQFELPTDQVVTFIVRPANCFGIHGAPLPPVTWRKA